MALVVHRSRTPRNGFFPGDRTADHRSRGRVARHPGRYVAPCCEPVVGVTRRERFVISIIAAPVALGLVFLTVRRLLAGPILPDFFFYRGAAQIGLTYGWSRI